MALWNISDDGKWYDCVFKQWPTELELIMMVEFDAGPLEIEQISPSCKSLKSTQFGKIVAKFCGLGDKLRLSRPSIMFSREVYDRIENIEVILGRGGYHLTEAGNVDFE